jgi:DNA-directed RNA polymerase specialized sigma24 family protein
MEKIIKHKINKTMTRLSDEDPDPLEQDEVDTPPDTMIDGWVPWDVEDMRDIHRLIENVLPQNQSVILTAFLEGKTYSDIGVTEKFYRWHFAKGVEFIRKALKI